MKLMVSLGGGPAARPRCQATSATAAPICAETSRIRGSADRDCLLEIGLADGVCERMRCGLNIFVGDELAAAAIAPNPTPGKM